MLIPSVTINNRMKFRGYLLIITSALLYLLTHSCSYKNTTVISRGNNGLHFQKNTPLIDSAHLADKLNNRTKLVELKDGKKWVEFEKKEIRALWITTVNNLDWPTTKGDVAMQKAELLKILDTCQALNFNAVILQVRPLSDALYESALEPWSSVLTGEQGKNPGYDPLEFAITEAHKRGLQLHAWINPYRVGPTTLKLASDNVASKHPSWSVTYNGSIYLNPGIPEVRDHLNKVVKDIITRYDVDAIHFDDYFYPKGAKSKSHPFVFNDKAAYNKYGKGKSLAEWRQDNVNSMVEEVYKTIKTEKPNVIFGISPSGRRENSLDLYADPLIWINNRWIDYLAPQIYWEFGHPTADFGMQAAYWSQNAHGVAIAIGVGAYKFREAGSPLFRNTEELNRQLTTIRQLPNVSGCFFFRARNFEDVELVNFLRTKFTSKTLQPFMDSYSLEVVQAPHIEANGVEMRWKPVSGAVRYAIYQLHKAEGRSNTYIAKLLCYANGTTFTGSLGNDYIVTAVSSQNLESAYSEVVSLQ